MSEIPVSVDLLFVLTTFLTLTIFYVATGKKSIVLTVALTWIFLQGLIGYSNFYLKTDAVPPRFVLLVLPPVICIVCLFLTRKGKIFLDSLNLQNLTLLHIVRIPVELVLYCLAIYKTVPEIMTFEGNNFDILSGITAPIIYYFGFYKKMLNKNIILAWNIICLGLLVNIVVTAILSAPFPFQRLAFDQPNIAVLHFPYIWLPGVIVPIVLLSHISAIRQLLQKD